MVVDVGLADCGRFEGLEVEGQAHHIVDQDPVLVVVD